MWVSLTMPMDCIERLIDTQGLDVLSPFSASGRHPGNFARPRRFEIAAALNRLRTVRMTHTVSLP